MSVDVNMLMFMFLRVLGGMHHASFKQEETQQHSGPLVVYMVGCVRYHVNITLHDPHYH